MPLSGILLKCIYHEGRALGGIVTVQGGGRLFGIRLLIKMVFAQVRQEIKSKLAQHYRRQNK